MSRFVFTVVVDLSKSKSYTLFGPSLGYVTYVLAKHLNTISPVARYNSLNFHQKEKAVGLLYFRLAHSFKLSL